MGALAPEVRPANTKENTAPVIEGDERFAQRHIGPDAAASEEMLKTVGYPSLDALIDATVPRAIRLAHALNLPPAASEADALGELRGIASRNRVVRNFIGMGHYGCIVPPVIQRNILENPGWYTQYTPYQAEISQGRLEALVNFQTMVAELTGLDVANASLLDEPTAAAEAMTMAYRLRARADSSRFFVSKHCHPQTIRIVQTRAVPLGIEVVAGDHEGHAIDSSYFGALLQYPATDGSIPDYSRYISLVHEQQALAIIAADLLSLALLKPPGEFGADIAVGSAQRFGVPMGYGGPHAGFLATRDAHKRQMPGRLVGVSRDAQGKPAYRLALQTREQHIRRDKATSNICTAQVLLAVMASMYAVYHGPDGLRNIASRVHDTASRLAAGLRRLGCQVANESFFDTLTVRPPGGTEAVHQLAAERGINLRRIDSDTLGISVDETTSDIGILLALFNGGEDPGFTTAELGEDAPQLPEAWKRTSEFLTHPVFHSYHTETEMLRYIRRLEARDLSLTTSMIPLGSCTMKLNATSQMFPVSWPEFANLHPFAPQDQAAGYAELFSQLETWLAEITGFAGISLQPNAGSQGEYAGLLAIRNYHVSKGEDHRKVCLIPTSAHGTNPASAAMAGYDVVAVACDDKGNINIADLREKAAKHADRLAAIMVTYPSTHGVFEETILEVCEIVHSAGGQVYMDGANMNAQVGLCRPGDFGVDVCHLNLHKTFCIPHGGGGPGMGPIGVAGHLVPFLPGHPLGNAEDASGPVSGAPYGSASILVIPWMYIRTMGANGLKRATQMAILNANYIARRLESYYPVLYKGANGTVAHECIIDLRGFKSAGVEVEDVAKRLMDYGFHAPTMSWPVPGTLMIEPTESESKEELDRFCDAMISIHAEIQAVASGTLDKAVNPLKLAPHTAEVVVSDKWDRPYSREQAAFPAEWTRQHKFWPSVSRIDNVYGDRNLFCACIPPEVN